MAGREGSRAFGRRVEAQGSRLVRAPLFSLLLFPIISQRCGQVVTGRAAGAQDDSCLQAPSQEEDPGSRGPGHSPFRAEGSGCAGCHLQSYLSGGGCGRPLVQAWTVPRDPWPSQAAQLGQGARPASRCPTWASTRPRVLGLRCQGLFQLSRFWSCERLPWSLTGHQLLPAGVSCRPFLWEIVLLK